MFKDFLSSNWCYGLGKIINSKTKLISFFWTIAVLFVTAISGFSMYNIIVEYLRHHTITITETNYYPSVEFPQITICYYKHAINVAFEDSILRCAFDGRLNCSDDFIPRDVYDNFGKPHQCYQFNSGIDKDGNGRKLKEQSTFNNLGINGLDVHFSNKSDTSGMSVMSGTRVMIFVNKPQSQVIYDTPDLIVPVNSLSIVSMNKRTETKQSIPYSQCVDDLTHFPTDLITRTINLNKVYQKSFCYFLCLHKHNSELHNCSLPGLYDVPNRPDCSFVLTAHNLQSVDYETSCSKQCPLECHSEEFTLNANTLSSEGSERNNTTLRLKISYKDLKVTETHQVPKAGVGDLIAKLGGQWGFLIGFRALSFVDIFVFVLESIKYLFRKNNNAAQRGN